ncbi:fasciclin domain-containing protein [Sphingomonas kaistensis]|uniref:Fasciclin domain-containing protein n=1 Tax=Sphingomonas kaistensis TaxID=298708 RepID=A0ABZ2FYS9_9SPHN
MRRLIATSVAALLLAACGQGDGGNNAAAAGESETNLSAQAGAPSQDLAAVVGASPRLAGLVKAAGMEKVLSGKEPYTILAPTDAALDKLPAGSLDNLDQPEQKAKLTALLRAHILPGTILAADLARAVENGKGKATIATMAGEPLTITRDGEAFRITDAAGQSARTTGSEQPARNGVVHSIDTVLAPAS